MIIRKAVLEDAMLLFDWRNEESVREQSFDREPLDWEVHLHWLKGALLQDDVHLFVAEEAGLPIGTFRLNRLSEAQARISIIVAPSCRGQGWGTRMIEAASHICRSTFGSVAIQADIRADNLPSQKAFAKAGYRLTAYRMEYEC